jgi:D-lactate dehydrogenase
MKVCFVSVEPEEKAYFARRLARWNPRFEWNLDAVPDDVEVLSIFIYYGIDEAFLSAHPGLRFIASRSSSLDHVDLEACRRHGVKVAKVGGSDGNSVAEHTFALLLAVARRFRTSAALRVQGDFSHNELRGFELRGKTLGLIGVGRIGARVAKIAAAFEMKVVAYDPKPDPALAAEGLRYESLDTVLAEGEILSLHAALTEATRHLINAETLAKCQEGVVIINTARGDLIDTSALIAALDSGQVGGVGLDVLEDERVLRADAKNVLASEISRRVHDSGGRAEPSGDRRQQIERLYSNNALLARPEVVFTPHIAFNTTESTEAVAGEAARVIEDFLEGREVPC